MFHVQNVNINREKRENRGDKEEEHESRKETIRGGREFGKGENKRDYLGDMSKMYHMPYHNGTNNFVDKEVMNSR